jgi:hypothetical protein
LKKNQSMFDIITLRVTHTNGTAYIRGTYSREYTHKHTQTQTNTQRGPTKYGAIRRDIMHTPI